MACSKPCPEHTVCPDVAAAPVPFDSLPIDLYALVGSKWCVGCYPEKKYAMYTYNGNSLCLECFVLKRSEHWL